MNRDQELSMVYRSMKLEKKWLYIGCSIGIASFFGVSYWLYLKQKVKKEEIIQDFLNRYKLCCENSLILKPTEQKQKNYYEETQMKILKDFSHQIQKYIYQSGNKDKFFNKVKIDKQYAKNFESRFNDLFIELLNQFLKFIQDQIKQRNLPSSIYMIDQIFDFIFEQFQQQLKYSNQYECGLLKDLVIRIFNHMLQTDLLLLQNDYQSSILQSHTKQQCETNHFEMIIRYVKLMTIKTQEKLHNILSSLIAQDSHFLFFLQISLAKNINYISCINSNFSQTLNELSSSQQNDSSLHMYLQNQNYIHQNLNNSFYYSNNTREDSNSKIHTNFSKTQLSQSYSHQQKYRKKLIPSPICNILSKGISIICAQQMIQEGFALIIIQNLCELSQKCSSDVQDLEKVLSNLYQITMNIMENKQNNEKFFQEYNQDILQLLLKSLSFQETNQTTTVSNSTIVDLVNWMTLNLDIILIRSKCSTWIQKILASFLFQNKSFNTYLGSMYLQEIRWIHKIRRDDKLKGYQQLETDLSITTLFLHLILNSLPEIPHAKNINEQFVSTIPFADDQERLFVIKSFSSQLQNYVFMKELFISMLEKSCTQSNHLIFTFTEFKNFFYSPQGRKYDEILLALQFMILLGGGDSLCDVIIQRWQKDAEEYEDFKIYMSSDIAFLLQILENDICYLNVNSNWQESLRSFEQKAKYRFYAYNKVQKLIINYLQIFGSMEKENIKEYIKHQISHQILQYDHIFESALEEVAHQNIKTSQENGNLYYSNQSHFSNQNVYSIGAQSTKYELKPEYLDKYFHSLFNRDIPLLQRLLNSIQLNQSNSFHLNQNQIDLHVESTLNDRDEPLLYLKQVRNVILENINLHTIFLQIFVENIPILLEKLRIVCRILNYIFDVIEEGILDCRVSKKIVKDSIKSLLVKYIFDPVLSEKLQYVQELRDEEGEHLAYQFIPTLQNIQFRREAIKDLIKDIFKGQNIADIIV